LIGLLNKTSGQGIPLPTETLTAELVRGDSPERLVNSSTFHRLSAGLSNPLGAIIL